MPVYDAISIILLLKCVCGPGQNTHDRHLQNINSESASILFFTFTLNMIFINAARSIFKAKTTYGHEL